MGSDCVKLNKYRYYLVIHYAITAVLLLSLLVVLYAHVIKGEKCMYPHYQGLLNISLSKPREVNISLVYRQFGCSTHTFLAQIEHNSSWETRSLLCCRVMSTLPHFRTIELAAL